MLGFAQVQVGKLGSWLLRCFLVAYVLTWLIGSLVENGILSPLWVVGF